MLSEYFFFKNSICNLVFVFWFFCVYLDLLVLVKKYIILNWLFRFIVIFFLFLYGYVLIFFGLKVVEEKVKM